MSLGVLWVEVAILAIGLIIIVVLFVFKWPPFNTPYYFLNPRTWQSQDLDAWLTPAFDYGPYNRDIPDPEIQSIYCSQTIGLPSKCLYSDSDAAGTTPPPTSCSTNNNSS